jgi:aryl-alcohol dehydrogenase-like predicted oxidoreductase
MRYKPLGGTGLLVSEVCLGTMTFGGNGVMWSKIGKLNQQTADAIVARALDGGVNFIDTADVYSEGQSEEITGRAMVNSGHKRTDIVLATKATGAVGKGPNDRGSSRGHIMDAVKASLKRLNTDYIDLYQIHSQDMLTPVEEVVRALDDLVRQGHVRYVGVSNWAAWRIMKALGLSDKHGWARFETLQSYYTIAGRDLERDLVPLIEDQNLGLMVWSPLAGGLLSGKYDRDGKAPDGSRRVDFDFPPVNRDRAFNAVDVMREIGDAKGVSVARIALAWVLHQKHVMSVIIGAKTVEQLDDNLAATEVKLTADELQRLDAVSVLPPEYPGWMVARQMAGRIPASSSCVFAGRLRSIRAAAPQGQTTRLPQPRPAIARARHAAAPLVRANSDRRTPRRCRQAKTDWLPASPAG